MLVKKHTDVLTMTVMSAHTHTLPLSIRPKFPASNWGKEEDKMSAILSLPVALWLSETLLSTTKEL